jgi:hypothetical protein
MKDVEKGESNRTAESSVLKTGHTKRCHQCNGSFGLVRHRLGLKQFCSIRCQAQHNADVERTTTRIKEWAHFLSQKL